MRNMLKEDNILNSRFGKKNHFQVPAGYFDQLTDRVMANLPEQEPRIIHMQPSLWQRMPIRKIAAAVAVLAVMGGGSVLALKYTGSSKPAMAHVDHFGSSFSLFIFTKVSRERPFLSKSLQRANA